MLPADPRGGHGEQPHRRQEAARMAGRGGRREDASPRAVWSRPDAEVHHREESPRAANETQRAGAHYWRLAKALHKQPIKK